MISFNKLYYQLLSMLTIKVKNLTQVHEYLSLQILLLVFNRFGEFLLGEKPIRRKY